MQRAPAPRARAFTQASSGLPGDWTHVRPLAPASAGTAIPRAQAGALAPWLQALQTLPVGSVPAGRGDAADARGAAASGMNAEARIELLQEGRVLGVLEIGADTWRYQPADANERPRSGPLDAQASAAWRAEIARLAALPR